MSDHKAVLIKPKKSNQEYYISTFNRAGLPFDYQCIVENDEIIRINMTPYFCFMDHITDEEEFKEIISSSNYSMKQYSKRKNKTYDVALKLSKGFDLKEPIKLYKQVKGLRVASDKELEQIEYKIVEYLSNYKKFYFKEENGEHKAFYVNGLELRINYSCYDEIAHGGLNIWNVVDLKEDLIA